MKNMKLMKFAFAGLMALIAFSSCSDDETYDVAGNDGFVFARADYGITSTGLLELKMSKTFFGALGADRKVSFPIRSTMPAKDPINVTCKVDNSLVAAYNEKHGTKYAEVTPDMLSINGPQFVIKKDSVESDSRVEISFNQDNLDKVELGKYLVPFKLEMVSGGMAVSQKYNVVYALITVNNDISASDIPLADRSKWSVIDFSSQEIEGENAAATNAIDGKDGTFWHTQWQARLPAPPHHITIDMGEVVKYVGFQYMNRSSSRGCATKMRVEVSTDNKIWTEVGTYDDLPQYGGGEYKKLLNKVYEVRYFKYTILKSNQNYVAMAEINAITVK